MSDTFGFVRIARRMVVLACAATGLAGCAEQARISLFDDVVVVDGGVSPAPPVPEDAPDASMLLDSSSAQDVSVTRSALVLRYDFEGQGELVEDRIGHANAMIRGGAALDAEGGLLLDGVDDYVDMPNGVLSSRRNVTIMAWLRWGGGPCWQRVFDFGSTDTGEDQSGRATTSLFLTPASCPSQVLTSMTERGGDQEPVAADRGLPTDRMAQVALTLDGDLAESALYVDGVRVATAPNAHLMSDLHDVNNWLGRSQWVQDRYLTGHYDELRIYNRVLSDDEVAELSERGPDQP